MKKERDRQNRRIGDESDERRMIASYKSNERLESGSIHGTIRIRLEKKYRTKTKSFIVNGEKETDVKFEHSSESNKGNERRKYTYPKCPYGLVNSEWRREEVDRIDTVEKRDEEIE